MDSIPKKRLLRYFSQIERVEIAWHGIILFCPKSSGRKGDLNGRKTRDTLRSKKMTSVKARKRKKRNPCTKTKVVTLWTITGSPYPFPALLPYFSMVTSPFQANLFFFLQPFTPSRTIHCRFLNHRGVLVLVDHSYLAFSEVNLENSAFLSFGLS